MKKQQFLAVNSLNKRVVYYFTQSNQKWKNLTNNLIKNQNRFKKQESIPNQSKFDEMIKEKEKMYNLYKGYKDQKLEEVPQNLVIKNLVYPKTKSNVLLLGIERRNQLHASFIHDCISNLKPQLITTQIPCDMPFFIRTKIDYEKAWEKFVKGKPDYKFYINPNPSSIYDIMLNQDKIQEFVGGSMTNSPNKFEIGSLFIYTRNKVINKFEVDAYLTPLLFLYNNPHYQTNLIFNDYPQLKYRDFINKNIELKELKGIYNQLKLFQEQQQQFLEEQNYEKYKIQAQQQIFDPFLLKAELFIQPKIQYIAECIRHSCFSSKQIISIVDRHHCDHIEDYWQNKMDDKIVNLGTYIDEKAFKIQQQKNAENNENVQLTDSYLEYLEKHVIIDLMLDQEIKDHFAAHRVFPYKGDGYLGQQTMIQQAFIILDHFYFTHQKHSKNLEPQSLMERMIHGVPNFLKQDKQKQE